MIGQKGLPAKHGGVERHVEELGARLVGLGHEVTVFTRPNYSDPDVREYRGMRLVSLPTIGTKHLDAIVHSVLASLACLRPDFDVVHYHAIGPTLASPITRVRGRAIVATIHGRDWKRDKWGTFATAILRVAEAVTLRVPHVTISVSDTLAETYLAEVGRSVVYVPNGIAIEDGEDLSVLSEFGLSDRGYLLFAGRLVPEKGAHYLLSAHERSGVELPLVVAGDSSGTDDYARDLRAKAGSSVIFTGYQYGERLAALFRHAALFVLPSDLEGLPIVLLEALAYGTPVLASDIAPNVEILGDKGRYFTAGNIEALGGALSECMADLDELGRSTEELRSAVLEEYDWDRVAGQVAECYGQALERRG